MRKINYIIWLIILLFFLIISGYLLLSEYLVLFLAPRMAPMVYFGFVVITVLFFFQLNYIKHGSDSEKSTFNLKYLLFIIPILLFFTATPSAEIANSLPNQNVSMSYNAGDEQKNAEVENQKDFDDYSDSTNDEMSLEEIDITDEEIEVAEITPCVLTEGNRKDKSVDQFTEYLYYETLEMLNNEVTMYGYVYKDNELPEDTVVVARQILSCCVADAYVVGYPVKVESSDDFNEGDWIEVNGIISKVEIPVDDSYYDYPIIVNGTIIMCDAPPLDEMYIYP